MRDGASTKSSAKYGEDNARSISTENLAIDVRYRKLAFIEMGLEPTTGSNACRQQATEGWAFERIPGDLGLIQSLVDGPWDEKQFLTVPPGGRWQPAEEGIIKVIILHGSGARAISNQQRNPLKARNRPHP